MEKKLPETLRETLRNWQGGPVRLMFQDEARFGRISDVRYSWCPRPVRPMCGAMIIREYTYAYSAVTVDTGELDSLVLPYADGYCMELFLKEVASRHPDDRIIMVMDGAGWHQTAKMKLPDNLRIVKLPPRSPELNPVENLWDELREKFFHNRVFDSIKALEDHLVEALRSMENNNEKVRSIVAWKWIIDSLNN